MPLDHFRFPWLILQDSDLHCSQRSARRSTEDHFLARISDLGAIDFADVLADLDVYQDLAISSEYFDTFAFSMCTFCSGGGGQVLFIDFAIGYFESIVVFRVPNDAPCLRKLPDPSSTLLFISSLTRIEFYACAICGVPLTVIERLLATIFVKDYELKHRRWICLIIIPGIWILAQFLVIPSTFLEEVPMIFPLSLIVLIFLISIISFGFLYRFNKRKLELILKIHPRFYSLSKKFQLEENLKVMWLIRSISIVLFILTLILILILILPSIGSDQKTLYSTVDLILALSSILMPCAMIFYLRSTRHCGFLRRTDWIFQFRRKVGGVRRTHRVTTTHLDTEVYFSQLNITWK
ncbi:unnamed protein product [Caenorhabditis angaria]|uniref:G-protein coupled receptors family 1 profile domain-containing protein n=1 Tax=Caenorhabditis angaria TaxID=860376 RepID=A0A9P1IDB3_9PELO|nr:unnamed protein product [Caenorhabditis angaria]